MRKRGVAQTATLDDIARRARVAVSTVSRALNPRTQGRISAATRERVERWAERLGYQPNRSARALSRGGSDTIAVVVPVSAHFAVSEYYARVILGAASAFAEHGLDVKLHLLRRGEAREGFVRIARRLGVDGLLIAGVAMRDRFGEEREAPRIPVVMINSYEDARVTTVDADNVAGGALAAEYLLGRGHRRLGMLAGPEDSYDALHRLLGFARRLREARVKLPNKWCVHSMFGEEEGAEAMRRILRQGEWPTAVFCANDELALGALRALREAKVRCPEDVSLIGFDNFAASEHAEPPLTTIAQPIDRIVTTAVELLVGQLRGRQEVLRVLLPVELIERGSVRRVEQGET
ncbi:MAG: LacI family transcriptional regulator [bacterium]|nr:LacI family transcriptional regulator [bacterium]